MAEDSGNSAATTSSDPFSGAKANLRDTVKWLATTLAALAAVIVAGTSLTGLVRLNGVDLWLALAGGAAAIIAVILVVALLLRLLISEAYYFGDLFEPENARVLAELERHAIELLPPSIANIAALREIRRLAVEKVRGSVGTPEYADNVRYLEQLRPVLASVTYFAQFERMRQKLRDQRLPLFALMFIGVVGLALFVVAVGKGNKAAEAPPDVTNIVYPTPTQAVPSISTVPSEAARNSAIRLLLTEAIRLNEGAGTPREGSSTNSHPILDFIHGLAEAGLVTADKADSLSKEFRSEFIRGTGDVLVHAANSAVDRAFPPEATPSATPSISISVSGCCVRCRVTTVTLKGPTERKKEAKKPASGPGCHSPLHAKDAGQ